MTKRDDVLAAFDALSAKLAPAKAWTQYALARRGSPRNGRVVEPISTDATSWCLLGAIGVVGAPYIVWKTLVQESTRGIGDYNDAPGRTQAEVLDLIARARARYEAEVPS